MENGWMEEHKSCYGVSDVKVISALWLKLVQGRLAVWGGKTILGNISQTERSRRDGILLGWSERRPTLATNDLINRLNFPIHFTSQRTWISSLIRLRLAEEMLPLGRGQACLYSGSGDILNRKMVSEFWTNTGSISVGIQPNLREKEPTLAFSWSTKSA